MKMMKTRMIITCVCVAGFTQAAVVEKPTAMPNAMLSVSVSDLHGFIDGVGSVAEQVAPTMNGTMLKNMLGMQLGDPGLSGMAPGTGLAVVALDQTNIFAVVELAEAQLATYTNALAGSTAQTRYADGLLIVAGTGEAAEKGIALAQTVKSTLLAKRSPTLNIAMKPAMVVEKNKDQIQGTMDMLPLLLGMSMQQTPGTDPQSAQKLIRILEGEIRVLLSMLEQCESAELVLAPQNGSIRLNETYSAKAGTRLATMLNAPKLNEPNPKIQSGLLGSSAIAIDGTLANPEALATFFIAELEELIKEMNLQVSDTAGLLDYMKKSMSIYGGSFSETVAFDAGGGLGVGYALEVTDTESVMALFRSMQDDMAPVFKLYADLGMPMSIDFAENARKYKDTDIHQFNASISLEYMPEEQLAPLAAMNLTNMVYDVAIVDNVMLYSMGGAEIETMIDRVKDDTFKVVPLKARSVYPSGGFYYCDIDISKYMDFIASMLPADPNNPLPQIAALLAGSEPITSAGFSEAGTSMWSINVPGSLIGKIGQAIMMQMQSEASMP